MNLKKIKLSEAVGKKLLGHSVSGQTLFLRFEGEEMVQAHACDDGYMDADSQHSSPDEYDLFRMGLMTREELSEFEEKQKAKNDEQKEEWDREEYERLKAKFEANAMTKILKFDLSNPEPFLEQVQELAQRPKLGPYHFEVPDEFRSFQEKQRKLALHVTKLVNEAHEKQLKEWVAKGLPIENADPQFEISPPDENSKITVRAWIDWKDTGRTVKVEL